MLIGGFQKFTMLDYPEKIAATVFTSGCNFRCPFCHNSEIVNPKLINYDNQISEEDVLDFLVSRKGDLDGICVTGGEPTLQSGLIKFLTNVKEMGFLIKLDTNASHSNVVGNLLNKDLVDYWAIDIKTTPQKYKIMTKGNDVIEEIENCIDLITKSRSELELRTTVVPGYVNLNDFDEIMEWINGINKKTFSKLYRYSVQNFKPEKTLHRDFEKVIPHQNEYLEEIAKKIRTSCKNVVIS
ncbi:anaerobic ribonucleoside-triphosphate reductase activating protein [Patescibacteria group bacterium]|nr:anaerobic ribonucleoside-triphosphate reductase activating protein [Patescibacteria group bacterium]